MLCFATEFPVDTTSEVGHFLEAFKLWIMGSPHSKLADDDLKIPLDGKHIIARNREILESIVVLGTHEDCVAVKWIKSDGDLTWATESVFSKSDYDAWVAVRTFVESNHPAISLPEPKKPRIITTLLDHLHGEYDGELNLLSSPHYLANDDINFAARIISGQAGYRLPVVYVSCGFDGSYIVRTDSLAKDLCGMAHVVVEPNRPFSRRLQIDVRSQNVYGGTIGIYWPEGAGRRTYFVKYNDTEKDVRNRIVDEIRIALANRRPLARCTWSACEEMASRAVVKRLKDTGSKDIDAYIEAFDVELKAKTEKLKDAEQEISRLRNEIGCYENTVSNRNGVILSTGTEQDLYPNEMYEMLIEVITASVDNCVEDSRRQHLLNSIVNSNQFEGEAKKRRDKLKAILKDYKSMSARIQKDLESLGFSISENGKHHKLTYQDDERYTFALPKSGSDYRGGLNALSDIAKRVF